MELHGDGTHRRARNGMNRSNQRGSRAKCSRSESSRYLRTFKPLRFDHELASRVGTRVGFAKATALIHGTGSRWQNSPGFLQLMLNAQRSGPVFTALARVTSTSRVAAAHRPIHIVH